MIDLNEWELSRLMPGGVVCGEPGPRKWFRVVLGDEEYEVEIQRKDEPASHTRPAVRSGELRLSECAEVIASMFKRLMIPEGFDFVTARDSHGSPMATAYFKRPTQQDEAKVWEPLDGSEREDGPGELDVQAGWEAYRKELTETMGPTILPTWEEAPAEFKECFAAGVWAAISPVAGEGVVSGLRERIRVLEARNGYLEQQNWNLVQGTLKGGVK
jgi:hypothetical protein